MVAQRITELSRRVGELEKAAQGDVPPTQDEVAARVQRSKK